MTKVWIKIQGEPIQCIIIGESSPIATANGVIKTYKVKKIDACPHCTFDITEDKILDIETVLKQLNIGKVNK